MARYTIIPERSRVWIDARSSVHPIHSTADGLEGFVDLDADDDTLVGPHPTAQLSFRQPTVVGEPARRSRTAQANRRTALPDHQRRAHGGSTRRSSYANEPVIANGRVYVLDLASPQGNALRAFGLP
jgi:hypothetical protein